MRPTQNGAKLTLVIVVTALLSTLFRDPVLAAISITLLTAMVLDTISALLKVRKASKAFLKPPLATLRVKAGESKTLEVEVPNPMEVELEDGGWYSASQSPSRKSIMVIVNPQLSGVYKLERLRAKVKGRMGLMIANTELPINLEVKAYPRVLPWIVEAARTLRAGLAGPGLAPGRRPGQGAEYHGTREYTPGDPLRLVEWKATARLSRLMVKEYLEELSSSPHIIYDERAPGPITADELAGIFLSSMVGVASTGVPIGLTIRSGGGQELHWEGLGSMEALEVALAHTLERVEAEVRSIYELLEPRPSRDLITILERAKGRGMARILRTARERHLNKKLKLMVRKPNPTLELTYIGHILYDTSALLELAEEARLRGHRLRIRTPSKPWRDSKSLEEAYIIHTSLKKALNSMRRMGVEVMMGQTLKP